MQFRRENSVSKLSSSGEMAVIPIRVHITRVGDMVILGYEQ